MEPPCGHDRLNRRLQQIVRAAGFDIAMKITRVSGVVYRQQLKPGAAQPKFAGEGRKLPEKLRVD